MIPVAEPLKAALDAAARVKQGPIILVNSEGRPWREHAFKSAFIRARKAASIKGLTFHDLRGTFVTRTFVAGSTDAQIAAVTGHSLTEFRSILDANYFHRDLQLAKAAIRKFETGTKLQTGLQTEQATDVKSS